MGLDRNPAAAVTVTVTPGPTGLLACVSLVGDIDMAVDIALTEATDRLRACAPSSILIDLAGVTFAGSTLANFLARVHNALPAVPLVACRPTPMTHRVLELTSLNRIAAVRHDLPSCWDATTRSAELGA